MKKIYLLLVFALAMIMPNLVKAENVTLCDENCTYDNMTEVLENLKSGDILTIDSDMTIGNATLESGIKLVIPKDVTVTFQNGTVIAKSGAIVEINGNVIVDNALLDISALSYGDNGLIAAQDGKISIKANGKVIMPTVWDTMWNWVPVMDAATHIFGDLETGACVEIAGKTFIYDENVENWHGAISVSSSNSGVYYETLASALAASNNGDTITLLADVFTASQTINKNITLDLNGHILSGLEKVLIVNGGTLNVIGTGTIKETKPYYGAIFVVGSNNADVKNYSNVTIGANVTLVGWSGVMVCDYGYGVNVTLNGTINAINDYKGGVGVGLYVNGNIQNKENYPIITINDNANITATGTAIYAAGYAKWNIYKASLSGVESGIGIKSGIVNLNGTNILATGPNTIPTSGYSNGINASGATIQLESNSDYAGDIELTIVGGTYKSNNGINFYEYLGKGSNTAVKKIDIQGGEFIAKADLNNFMISQNLAATNTHYVSGGTFSANPSNYLKESYKVVYDNNVYTVSKIVVTEGKYSISGTITDGENATVQLKQGNEVLYSTIANDEGTYVLENIASGTYNLVVLRGTNSTMKLVTVADKNLNIDMVLSDDSSVNVLVVGASTPNIVVEGLEEVGAGNIELLVELKETDKNNEEQKSILEQTKNKNTMFLEIDLLKDERNLTETDNVLHFVISLDTKSMINLELYRYHDDKVDKFTKLDKLPSEAKDYTDKTFYVDVDAKEIHVFTDKFSTYAVSYNEIENPKTFDGMFGYTLLTLISVLTVATIIIYKKKVECHN